MGLWESNMKRQSGDFYCETQKKPRKIQVCKFSGRVSVSSVWKLVVSATEYSLKIASSINTNPRKV